MCSRQIKVYLDLNNNFSILLTVNNATKSSGGCGSA